MTVVEYFEPCNVEHLKAYDHLERTGVWPKKFLPEEISFPMLWQVQIMNKMAECWLRSAKNGHIFGMPIWNQ